MNYDDALAFLGSRINYERRGMPANQELRLDRVAGLLAELGAPHEKYPIVHVAGTKGKGSTSNFIAALLRAAGFRVGLHTSPHLERIEERFRIDGVECSPITFANLVAEMAPLIDRLDRESAVSSGSPPLTYFEITTGLTLLYFERERVDFAVVEVGMGGRLDSTNVVTPAVSVITCISKDHTRQLGDTLALIAREKAGIIKPGRPVVSGGVDDEPRSVIRQVADERGSRLLELDRDFFVASRPTEHGSRIDFRSWSRTWPTAAITLLGQHQAANAAVALAAIDVLIDAGYKIDSVKAVSTLEKVQLPGRVEKVCDRPLVILDVAHNDGSALALVQTLSQWHRLDRRSNRTLVFGTSRDKDWRTILGILLPHFDRVILTTYQSNPRALPAAEIVAQYGQFSIPASIALDPQSAWTQAEAIAQAAGGDDVPLICIMGSFFLIAEVRPIWAKS